MQLGVAAPGRGRSGAEMQLGAAAAGRGRSRAEVQRGVAAVGRGCGGAWMLLRGAAGCCCNGAFPQLPTAPSLSLQLCAERGTEIVREAFLIPLVVLSPSPSHTSSPRPPQVTAPLSSPQPTSSSLYDPSKSPHPPTSPFPSSATLFILPPFTCSLPFPLSTIPSRPPLLPFSLFLSLSPATPVTSPNPFVLS